MTRYLLSVHSVAGEVREPMSAEEMQHSWQQIGILEAEMKSTGAWVFSGRLHEPETATVVRVANGEILTTDGPFAEAKEHLGGFYIINAEDLDAALAWASKVTRIIGAPIEVLPIAASSTPAKGQPLGSSAKSANGHTSIGAPMIRVTFEAQASAASRSSALMM